MAQYKVADPDDNCICPYDATHVMPRKRLQYHLIKCRKNHPTADMAVCRFNNLHVVPRVELRYHMSKCPDRALVEQDIIHQQSLASGDNTGEYFHGDCSVPSYNAPFQNLPKGEDWDRECEIEMRKQDMMADVEENSRLPYNLPAPVVDQSNSVFAYSLSMSGLGRGRQPPPPQTTSQGSAATPMMTPAASENTSLLQTLARGRGVGAIAPDTRIQAAPVVGLLHQKPTPYAHCTGRGAAATSSAPTTTTTILQAPVPNHAPKPRQMNARGRRGGVCGSSAFRLPTTQPVDDSQKAQFVVPKIGNLTNGTSEQ